MSITPLWRTALNFGAMSGISGFAFFLILFVKGINPLGPASWLGIWIPVIFICIATKYYRNRLLGGSIKYWNGFKIGILTGLCSSFLYTALVYIFVKLFNPEILEKFKEIQMIGWENSKDVLGDDIYEMGLESVDKLTIGLMSYGIFIQKMITVILVAFITAAAYRKLPSPTDE